MLENNLSFAILRRAFDRPDAIAFAGSSSVSYQRYAELVVHFARRMREFGVDRSSTVGLVVKSPVVALLGATAVGLLGARWHGGALLNRPRSVPGSTHIFAGMGESEAGAYEFTRSWFEAPAASVSNLDEFAGHARGDDTWMITHSSGTTGKPKFMSLSYEAVWRRTWQNVDLLDGKPLILASLFEPMTHVGVRPRLGNLFAGGTNVNTSGYKTLASNGVNRVMGSPSHIAGLIRGVAPPAKRIRSCRLTGAAVTRQFLERALEYFELVQVLYGSTEAGAVTLAQLDDDTPYGKSAGRPVEGAEIRVVDESGAPLPDGTEGIVRVRTGWMVPGYIGEPELTKAVFRDGWFEPGDLGYVDRAGALHISGRTGDVINTGGVKFNAVDVDEVLQLHPDVEDGYCFVERDEQGADVLSAVVSLRSGARQPDPSAMRGFTLERLGRAKSLRRLYVVDTVLRNENGKPMRAESAKAAQSLTRIDLV